VLALTHQVNQKSEHVQRDLRETHRIQHSIMFGPNHPTLIAVLVTFATSVSAQLPGDFNGDGVVGLNDVDLLSVQIASANGSPAFDVDADGAVNLQDLDVWVHELAGTWFGDANLDGEFNAADINQVFIAGKYNTLLAASWSEGDWNADLVFDINDLNVANVDGGYTIGDGGNGDLPVTVYELFNETPSLELEIVTFSIGEIKGVLLSWGTTSRSVQLQSTTSLQDNWEDVTASATPDEDGRTYVALTDLSSSGYF
jgi:hypothetical protein